MYQTCLARRLYGVRCWSSAVLAAVGIVAATQSAPTVRGSDVTFVAAGDRSDPPRIVADFNGWNGSEMTPSADGRTFTLRVTLDPAARIEYLIAYRDRFVLDPGNPLSVPAPAGPPRSELRMPAYRPPAPSTPARLRGTIETVVFESRTGERRRLRVYAPPAGRSPLSVVYVHDGDIFLEKLELPALLDSLIDAGQIESAIAVFVDAVDRHDDYEPGSPLRTAFTTEIVPLIERQYAIAGGRRALMGLSRSTLGAIDTCANGGIQIDACALVAPAVTPQQFDRVLPPRGSAIHFYIAAGSYDIPLVADARALRDELERRRVPVRYAELPQGHNHTAFRAALPALLRELLGHRSRDRTKAE